MDDRQDQAYQLFQQHWREVGFFVRDQLDEYSLYTVDRDGDVLGAALADHTFSDHTLVHAIAVADDARGQGIGQSLVDKIAADSPHETLTAKCDTDLPANEFYRKSGWEKQRVTGDGQMSVWQYDR